MQRVNLMQGWELEVEKVGAFEIVNRGQQGERRFFRIIPGPYSHVIEEEPEQAYPLGINNYVDGSGKMVAPAMKVKGIIVKKTPGPGGEILYRANLTNFFGRDQGKLLNEGAEIEVKGERYVLYRLVAENKNRIQGYIGFYAPAHGGPVQILEVEDLG